METTAQHRQVGSPRRLRAGKLVALASVPVLIGAGLVVGLQSTSADASDEVKIFTSYFTATNGEIFTATNHLVQDTPAVAQAKRDLVKSAMDGSNPEAKKIVTKDGKIRHEWIVVWAGDWNAGDNNSASAVRTKPIVSFDPKDVRDNSVGPGLPRRRRRHEGFADLRQGRQHRYGRPGRRERAAPHAVPVAQGRRDLRRRSLQRLHLRLRR